jgi:hypothetical protein
MEKFKEFEKRVKNLIADYQSILESPFTKEDRKEIYNAKIESLEWCLKQARTLLTSFEK